MVDDRCGSHEYRSESSHDGEESLDDLEKSSHVLEEAVAVLPILRHDGCESRAVVEESLHVVLRPMPVVSGSRDDGLESRASSTLSFDVRPSSSAVMAESFPRLSESRA